MATSVSAPRSVAPHRRSTWRRYQVTLVVVVVLLPLVVTASVAGSYAYSSPMDAFENTLSSALPLVFGVVVVCFGCLTLTWQLNHRFLASTRVREDVRRQLVRRAAQNAAVVGVLFFAVVIVAAIVLFEVVPRLGLIDFRPEELLEADGTPYSAAQVRQHDVSMNTWTFLYAAGWPVYAVVYGAFVALSAALWATLGFALVLLVPNRYLALSLPFLLINIVDFVIQVLGAPQFSPLISVFPFNITAQPLWTSFVPLGALALLTAGTATYCWHRADHLESLS